MNGVKELFKRNIFLIVVLAVAIAVTAGITYSATTYLFNSNIVGYDNSNSGLNATDVQSALDELYNLNNVSGSCPNGYVQYSLGNSSAFRCILPTAIDSILDNAVIDNIASTYVTSSTGINFNAVSSSTNGQGLYIRAGTENDMYPIYYFRGAVDNNHVLFANFCWRIVRTTNTGGVKLIYDGVPSGGECNNTSADTQLSSTSLFNTNSNSLADSGYMYGTRYTVGSATGSGWYYGPTVTYSGGSYTLTATSDASVTTLSTVGGNSMSVRHYTCKSTSAKTCATVSYVFLSYSGTGVVNYINLSNGKKIEDALSEMLTNSSNANNSTIKGVIDTWYGSNMTSYTNKIEDTIYCNDRSIFNLGGWNYHGGDPGNYTSGFLRFSGTGRVVNLNVDDSSLTNQYPSLLCLNKNDSFTVTESDIGNGELTYPVGLLTVDETMLAGINYRDTSTSYLVNSQKTWTMSPFTFNDTYSHVFQYNSDGIRDSSSVATQAGVRPVISVALGSYITSGDGSGSNPYIIE